MTDKNNKLTHIKIHGSVKNKNLIFGVDDNAKINPNHIFIKKSVNDNFQTKDFSTSITECNSLGIFGHSLGKTDHMYFQDYFKNACKTKNKNSEKDITIYYHGESSKVNIYKQLDILTNRQISKFKQNNRVELIDTSLLDCTE